MGIFRRKTSNGSVLGGQEGDEPSRAYAPVRDGIKAELEFPAKLQDWFPGNVAATLEKLFTYAVRSAEQQIAWYNSRGQKTGARSRQLRVAAGASPN